MILEHWFLAVLRSYPPDTATFLKLKRDPFQNPVGQTLRKEMEILYDDLVAGKDGERVTTAIENIIRIRAVQDFTPSQAVSFLLPLKNLILERIRTQGWDESIFTEFWELINRIDHLALCAFDHFARCREKLYEIRIAEIKKWSIGSRAQNSEKVSKNTNHGDK